MIGGEREREMKKNTIADKEEKLRGNVGGEKQRGRGCEEYRSKSQ